MDLYSLTEDIRKLEEELQLPEYRKDPQTLDRLIADEFLEIGKSGSIYNKTEIIDALNNEVRTNITMSDFSLSQLAENIVLVMYTAHQAPAAGGNDLYSRRTSVWKLFGNDWKIIFHQGTPINVK